LGIEAHYAYTPRVYRRVVFAAVHSTSFDDASEAMQELAELPLLPKRIWRGAKRVGEERIAECEAAAEAYEQLPLPARHVSPVEQVPRVACVQMDGGRFQVRERENASSESRADSADGEGHWREYKAGVLLSMTSDVHAEDPCPELPATFADPGKMRQMAREIKGFTHDAKASLETKEQVAAEVEQRASRPEVLVKSVVATSGDVEAFGRRLVAAAYARGFHAAQRKAFLGDGSATNWSVWRALLALHADPRLRPRADVRLWRRHDGPTDRRGLVLLSRLGPVVVERRASPLAGRRRTAASRTRTAR
jgi:hypothetical protein